MSIDAISSNHDSYETNQDNKFQSTTWIGKEILDEKSISHKMIFKASLSKVEQVVNGVKSCNNYPIDHFSYPVGKCARNHLAYYIYHQSNHDPIYLCKEKREWCAFEYYNFLAFLRGELTYSALRIMHRK